MIDVEYVEHLLETYTLEEILELNDLTLADVLYMLHKNGDIELPNPEPL